MRSSSDAPLSKEDQFAANLAMAARKETETFKSQLAESLRIKMWCIERGIEDDKQGGSAAPLAREFYKFLTE
jgi:hypothetical protein